MSYEQERGQIFAQLANTETALQRLEKLMELRTLVSALRSDLEGTPLGDQMPGTLAVLRNLTSILT